MLQSELEIRFHAGQLTTAKVVPELMGKNWNLLLEGKKKSEQYLLTLQREDKVRSFKTIDAAANVGKTIGFQEVKICFVIPK